MCKATHLHINCVISYPSLVAIALQLSSYSCHTHSAMLAMTLVCVTVFFTELSAHTYSTWTCSHAGPHTLMHTLHAWIWMIVSVWHILCTCSTHTYKPVIHVTNNKPACHIMIVHTHTHTLSHVILTACVHAQLMLFLIVYPIQTYFCTLFFSLCIVVCSPL